MKHYFILLKWSCLLALANAAQAQTFTPMLAYSSGTASKPCDVAAADVNNDGKLDLLTANYDGDAVGVLLGNGNGTFQTVIPYSTGGYSTPYSIVVADVNGDGKLDVLTANYSSNAAGVLLGNGNGTFQSINTYSTGIVGFPYSIAAADVNSDGKLDIVAANSNTDNAGVLLGNGNGTFQAVKTYSTGMGSHPFYVTVADINGDNKPDVLTANNATNTIGILSGNGDGTFQPVTAYGTGIYGNPYTVIVRDINGDGKLDLAASNYYGNSVGVLLGNGNGTFQPVATYYTGPDSFPVGLAVSDVNLDGRLDLLTANFGISTSAIGILTGSGNGIFNPVTTINTGTNTSTARITVADVNSDGKPDLLVANRAINKVGVLLNTTPLATRTALPGASATLFPNPATTAATLILSGLPAAVAQVQATLLDATGRAVGRHALAAAQGSARAELPTTALTAGLYVLRLEALDAQGQPTGSLPAQRLSIQ